MKPLLFVCFLSFVALPVLAFPTPQYGVPAQCADPTFACQDLESARTCGVVKSCIHDIWANMRAPDDNDEICDICKEMVKEARDQLLSNMTQEEIKEVFEGSCKLLPVKIIAEGCIKVVDEIIPEIVEMLASRMDPNMVCTVSGMCFPSKSNNVIENQIRRILNFVLIKDKDAKCDECTTMVTDVQTFLKSESESDIKTILDKACKEKMPSYLCKIVLNSYFHEIYTYVLSTTPAKLCSSAGVCPQTCELKTEESKVKDDLTCEFCEHLLEHVKDLVTTNTTMEEFKNALLNFCKTTGKFSDKCTALVNDYYDMLFSYIKNLDSKGMCTLMGLCNSGKCFQMPLVKLVPSSESRRKVPLIKIQLAQDIETNDINSAPLVHVSPAKALSKKMLKESNDIQLQLPIERFIHPLPGFEQDTECALCKAFSFYLETDLASDRSKDGVRNTIGNICEKWMKDYPAHCSHIVNKYSYKMQMAIAKGVAFDKLCSEMKVCPLEEDTTGELKVKVLQMADGTLFCDLCKDAMNEVEKQLNDPATKQRLEDLLGQVCKVLPKSLRDDCVSFINQNVDAVLDILQQELKPDNICPALRLCSTPRLGISPRVNDLKCDVCKDMVTSFRQKLQDPASKEMVQTFLEEGCAQLPGSIAAECKSFVDANIDYLMKIIIEEMDPQKVCAILSICPASLSRIPVVKPAKVNDVECDLCKEVVGKVEDMVKDQKTEDEIKQALDKVCSYLPSSLGPKCVNFVNQYTDLIITLLMQELDPAMVCAELKLCPASLSRIPVVETAKVNDVECDLCKEVVGKVEDMVKDQKTEDEIKAALDKVCSYLPSSWSPKCVNFVNQYTDLIVTLLMQELDPAMVCAELKLCPASLSRIPVVEPAKVNDVECDLCKEVVGKVEDMVKDQKTEDEIKAALDKVCSYLPSSLAPKCESFVNQYTDLLVTLLMQELDPATVCAELKLCPESMRRVEEVPLESFNLKDVECDLCKEVVGKLEDMIKDKKTEDEIKNALDKVCSYLPSSMSAKCQKLIDQYTDLLITILMQEADPQMVCAALNLCTDSERRAEAVPLEAFKLKDLECDLCKEVVGKLEDMLKDKSTEDEIKAALNKVCSYLPSSLATKCEKFVNQYFGLLITILSEELNPDIVCAAVSVCPEKANFTEWQSKAKDLECKGCQYALNFLQQQLLNAQTQEKVKEILKKACALLPQTYSSNCDAYVDEYGNSLLVLLAHEINPSQLCFKAQMCTNETKLFMKTEPEIPAASLHLDECSVCTTIVDYLDRLIEEDDVDKEITHLVERVCTVLPTSYQQKCSTALEAYGPYILQMIGQMADSKQICQDIDMCARSPAHAHLIGGSKCTFGPSYWCRSQAHAASCQAESYCKDKVWKN